MSFIPSGVELSGWTAPVKRRNAYTAVYLDRAIMPAERDDAGSHLALEPMLHFEDRTLGATIAKLGSLLDEISPNSMYAETLGLLLGVEIQRAQRSWRQRTLQQLHGLSPKIEETIREYIEANLSRDITLTELAELAGLSRFHFARSFRRSMGLPPHQYLLQRRIERAKELLALGKMPVSEVATAVGFPGPTPLARTFLRITGTHLKEFARQD
jgi:AraC family transcriptional regulator